MLLNIYDKFQELPKVWIREHGGLVPLLKWMKNPMANAASLQEYEVAIDTLISNLILIFSALLTLLELFREADFQQGVIAARYAIASGLVTLIVRKLPLPLMARGVILLTIPTVMAATSAITDPFFLFVHHIFFILVVAASLYFDAKLLLTYGIVLNLTLAILYAVQPTSLFGGSENPGDVYFIFALLNGSIFILYHVMQWVRLLLVELLYKSERLQEMAYTDFLTGINNRASLVERLERDIHWAKSNAGFMAVIALDVDNFKEINDTFGHSTGDQVLVKVAERIRSCLRAADTVARIGGDEFCVLLTGIREPVDALLHTNRMIECISTPVRLQNEPFAINVSVGLAFYPRDGSDPNTLLKIADQAMYQAKRNGKNCLRGFEKEMPISPVSDSVS